MKHVIFGLDPRGREQHNIASRAAMLQWAVVMYKRNRSRALYWARYAMREAIKAHATRS